MSETGRTAAATILVVEDRLEVLEVVQRTLSGNGYEVLTATDGDLALQVALDRLPDLLILDIGLPKKNGYAVAAELRARAFASPILMLTARDTVQEKVAGLDAGADDSMRHASRIIQPSVSIRRFRYAPRMTSPTILLTSATSLAIRATARTGHTTRWSNTPDWPDVSRCAGYTNDVTSSFAIDY